LQGLLFKFILDTKTRLAVLLLLLIMLAYQISITVWNFIPQPEMAGLNSISIVRSRVNKPSQQTTPMQKVAIISKAHLFGIKNNQAAPVITEEEAPETKLKYKLRGIFFSTNTDLSSVILEKSRNDVKHYLLNSELADGVKLAMINIDHILIERYGKLEKLMLEKEKGLLGSKNDNLPSLGSATQGSAAATAVLKTYKRKFSKNPMSLARKFQAVSVSENGKNIGFKLKALRGETLLKKLKFRSDDVFTAINGIGLDKPFQALDALKSLTTSDSASVTFIRDGSKQTVDFKL